MTNSRDTVEEACAGTLSRGTRGDSVFEHLRLQNAARAGGVRLRGPPGGVGSQVTFPSSHLVDATRHELAQTHEQSWVNGRRVVVVGRWGEQSKPVLNEHLPDPFLQGGVCAQH